MTSAFVDSGQPPSEQFPPHRGVVETSADSRGPPRSPGASGAGPPGGVNRVDVGRRATDEAIAAVRPNDCHQGSGGASSMATIHSAGFNGFSDDRRMGQRRPSSVGHPDVLGYSLEFQRADPQLVEQVVQLLPLMGFEDRFQTLIRPLDEWVDLGAQSRALAGQ